MIKCVGQRLAVFIPSRAQIRDRAFTHKQVLHRAVARSRRDSNAHFTVDDTWPFQRRDTGQQARHASLKTGVTTEAGAPFDNDSQHKDMSILLKRQTSGLTTRNVPKSP